jgi:glycerol-3-phosphate dehydrogenase
MCQHLGVSFLPRPAALAALEDQEFDVVVVGAGMTGTGVAVDAASRGLRVALLDGGDIASGTSSKSSKMAHGGLRYLQQKEFRLVYENLHERQRLLTNAPHLIRPLPFLIPLFGKNGVVSKTVAKSYATALRLYDLTGGWRIGQRYQKVTKEQTLAHLPSLRVDRLVAGFLYFDARGDDARVALTLARTAAQHGAVVVNYARVTSVTHDAEGAITGVVVTDQSSSTTLTVRARCVVNASGVWADEIFTMTERAPSHRITPAKGVHLTVPFHRLPADVALVMAVPGDRRSIFVLPFEEAAFTFIGTTDTAFDGDIDTPLCTPDDVTYLLNAVNASTDAALTPDDITGLWAGLRPLLRPQEGATVSERTADLSRRHSVQVGSDGAVHITGGKWTTYRQMAEDTVDVVVDRLGVRHRCATKRLPLFGAPGTVPAWSRDASSSLHTHLWRRYGDEGRVILDLIGDHPELGDVAIEGLPYRLAEFVYAAQHELAVTLIDLLTRRTRAHLQDARATLRAANHVATAVAPWLGWRPDDVSREVASYRALVHSEFTAAGLPLKEQ